MGPAGGLARGPAWWAALALLRVAGCLLPQPGYLHPDEFFQSPEVMAGDILDLQVYYPWEFLSSSPCRTVVFPLITSGVTYWVIKFLQQLGVWPKCINSYTLLVAPRLLLTTFSFILDYTVYRLTLYILPPFNQRIAQTVLKRSTHSALQTHVHPRQWGQSRLSDGCAGPQQSAGNSQGPTGDRPW
ncbi:GPI mannosyltransferase 4 isoform A [Alligator mississippiensis]|uniref:Mannosyltransferase n=1 Tax=Alligator mississippiensis TaxID=8496 RepID=A0A151P8F5_ALLMI|nr:GPI mannosyltransferase 4 isoform A [Alligator mississippiensis]